MRPRRPTTTTIGNRLDIYQASPRDRRARRPSPDFVVAGAAIKGMILDSGDGFDPAALPAVYPGDRPQLEHLIVDLSDRTPDHKWNRLHRIAATAHHYDLDIAVKEPRA